MLEASWFLCHCSLENAHHRLPHLMLGTIRGQFEGETKHLSDPSHLDLQTSISAEQS